MLLFLLKIQTTHEGNISTCHRTFFSDYSDQSLTKFPEFYSASPAPVRKSRSEKLQEQNNKELAEAFRKCQEEYKQRQKENEVQSLHDIKQKLKHNNNWKLLDYNKTLSICTLGYSKESGPNIISALTVDESLMQNA